MKLATSVLLLLAAAASSTCDAFVPAPAFSSARSSSSSSAPSLLMSVDLAPEPEGGEELTAVDTMAGSRMKVMGETETDDPNVKAEDGSTVYDFWLTAEADGTLIKEVRTRVSKDASRKANFPGFRKGQIPPYAQPQITNFAVQEGIINTIEAAVGAYGLKSLPGDAGSVEVLEDVTEMCKGYKTGDPLQFTATFRATYDEEKRAKVDAGGDDVVDAEVVEEEKAEAAE
uniref:Trigger factor ribosome-binding bacterial domain-containing protein n=1 Tax=Trieres chinensis TaxID=1514140 RepID=A0A7S1Z771_TRICV|mmetsp:Transcript_19223/g.38982  ORF Transcript_19223/g.38982 Transcript_19223/m.38982 type:complete len:229 (+) Transcript_19223:157-843(+)|eukprot:CAMPEP_0183299022 /NCGR_PEP_ID=MMETSP0160_2-20130417/5860_1 /TAXON_ID=2839 ORGANISM="Odontella Sinensis, Strain Grunow 1884" /NCGR_SAMPLE_ID=MMETSP0160_2 /ASSEMBLY_ACC=CAM_ASM_000250 /LENGTH=228 /DNA_ID=CAMNT_0025461169 /DNA_START=149 /DNA_END=835 /DNA_ORIENTATION=-